MSRRGWATGAVIQLAAAVAVSTAPVATAVVVAPQAPVFPLTLTRTGGIAGFQDVLVVGRGGRVSVTSRGQRQRPCRLMPEAVTRVRTAAAEVPWSRITPDRGEARFPDDLVIMVRSPAGGPVRLEDPKVGPGGTVFQELLSDVLSGPGASRLCKAA